MTVETPHQHTFSERVKELIEHYANGSNSRFASLISINPRRINHIVTHKDTNPTLSFITSVAVNLPEVSLDWLILNAGKMLREKSVQENSKLEEKIKNLEQETEQLKIENIRINAQFDFLKKMYDEVVTSKT